MSRDQRFPKAPESHQIEEVLDDLQKRIANEPEDSPSRLLIGVCFNLHSRIRDLEMLRDNTRAMR